MGLTVLNMRYAKQSETSDPCLIIYFATITTNFHFGIFMKNRV